MSSVAVQVGCQQLIEDGHERLERLSANEPLEVGAIGVVIWTVQPRTWDDAEETMEEGLVTGMHTDRDRGLAPVAPEAPLAHEHAYKEPQIEGVNRLIRAQSPAPCVDRESLAPREARGSCYTVW